MSWGDAHEIVESTASRLTLSREQAASLVAIGRRLAARKQDVDESERTLIECSSSDGTVWRVRVVNAVGVVGLPGGMRIAIRPKIPLRHLMFLLGLSHGAPRTTPAPVGVSGSPDLQDLIAVWFLDSLDNLLRGGLAKAYVDERAKLPMIRGRIDVRHSVIDLARGNLGVTCEYEEFTEDSSLNRVLIAAARKIARNRLMPTELRRRARSCCLQMPSIGPMRPTDLQVEPDRVAARYVESMSLARLLLGGVGVGLEDGLRGGSAFLLPTPLMVEAAIRRLVAEALSPSVSVTRGRAHIGESGLTVNPDLDFGRIAVGDVKYKLWDGSWVRADLYQLVAFAVAFDRRVALHVGFGGTDDNSTLEVGGISLWRISWPTSEESDPATAAVEFQDQVRRWWEAVGQINYA